MLFVIFHLPAPLLRHVISAVGIQASRSGLKASTVLKHCLDAPSYPPTAYNNPKNKELEQAISFMLFQKLSSQWKVVK